MCLKRGLPNPAVRFWRKHSFGFRVFNAVPGFKALQNPRPPHAVLPVWHAIIATVEIMTITISKLKTTSFLRVGKSNEGILAASLDRQLEERDSKTVERTKEKWMKELFWVQGVRRHGRV